MKILMVLQSGAYGGANKILYWLASEFYSAGYQTTVVAMEKCSNIKIYNNGWRFVALNRTKSTNFFARNTIEVMKEFDALRRCILFEDPDIIISFCDHSFYPTLLCAKLLRKPLLISERVDPYTNRSRSEKVRRMLYRFADAAVFQTQKAKEFYSERLQNRAVVIHNPVRGLTKETLWKEELAGNSIIYLGRIDILQKRLDVLLDAFKQVLKQFPDYKLMIYGDGRSEDTNRLKQMITDLDITDSVELCGVTDSPENVLKSSKLFVFTSDFEGIPNSVIEAMNVGIPIVATDCSPGGARLLLGDSEYGELVECGNSNAVAEAIIRSLNNMEVAMIKVAKGKRSLDRFSPDLISAQWISFVKGVVNTQ